jgi:hypothetical protein
MHSGLIGNKTSPNLIYSFFQNVIAMYSVVVHHYTTRLRMSKDNTWQTLYRKHRVRCHSTCMYPRNDRRTLGFALGGYSPRSNAHVSLFYEGLQSYLIVAYGRSITMPRGLFHSTILNIRWYTLHTKQIYLHCEILIWPQQRNSSFLINRRSNVRSLSPFGFRHTLQAESKSEVIPLRN